MKHIITMLMAAIAANALGGNPIITTAFTPDPAPYVHGDTVYLFVDHDEDDAQYFKMKDWMLYSTDDMSNWTYRGTPMSTETFKWAKQGDNAWASQAVERNGKWYWYICAEDTTAHLHGIGVGVANSPEGPYTDPLGKPLVPGNWGYIDPSVFIDDDGQAYLFWGNNGCWYAALNPDMISLASEIKEVPGLTDPEAFGPLKEKYDYSLKKKVLKTNYEEGPWVTKRDGIYYLVYAAGGVPEHMAYSTSSSIHGPWKYQGRIMDEAPGSFTIHGGNIEIGGRNFMFYHDGKAPNGGGFRRSTSIEEFEWLPDGKIPMIPFTDAGVVKPLKNFKPYGRIEAETMSASYGIKTDRSAGKQHYITRVHNGDWVKLSNADFGSQNLKKATTFKAMARHIAPGSTIELRTDHLGGPVIAELSLSTSMDWSEQAAYIQALPEGVHDIYLLFRGPDTELFELDYWSLD